MFLCMSISALYLRIIQSRAVCEDRERGSSVLRLLVRTLELILIHHREGDGLIGGRKRSRTQGLCITRLERITEDGKKGYRIAWKGIGWSHWQLRSERVMEMVEVDSEAGMKTDYVCWESKCFTYAHLT